MGGGGGGADQKWNGPFKPLSLVVLLCTRCGKVKGNQDEIKVQKLFLLRKEWDHYPVSHKKMALCI